MKFKPKDFNLKMTPEELQNHLQMKRQFTGSHRSKKDYDRKKMKSKLKSLAY